LVAEVVGKSPPTQQSQSGGFSLEFIRRSLGEGGGFRSALCVPASSCKEKFDKDLFLWYIRVSPEFEGGTRTLKK
jgi:hypothetical protein